MRAHTTIAQTIRAQAATLLALADVLERESSDEWITVPDAAALARCTPRSIRNAIKRGKLAARGEKRHVVIAKSDLDAWLRALPPRKVDRTERAGVAVEVTADDEDALVDELLAGAAE